MNTLQQAQWVFVCGCARSGTSTMADLLRSHKNFAIGRERYGRRFRVQSTLSQDLFEKKRFCTELVEGDSHHKALDGYYKYLSTRFESCTHIGDKIPHIHKGYDEVMRVFPGCKFVFMVRNILDVAHSFEMRRQNSEQGAGTSWPVTRGYRQAVEEWNLSLADTIAALNTGAIHVVDYEMLYQSGDVLSCLFSFLKADLNESVSAFWDRAATKRRQLDRERVNALTPDQKQYIMRNSNFENYEVLLSSLGAARLRQSWKDS